MCITTAGLSLIDIVDMIAAVADCFSALKSSRKKSPNCVSYKYGDLPILWSFNLEALGKYNLRHQFQESSIRQTTGTQHLKKMCTLTT